MGIVIAVALQKGGVGKSTTAETIAAILSSRGKDVLLVDMDSQANVTFISGNSPEKTITDVLNGDIDLKDVVCHGERYDLVAADEYLANFEQSEKVEPTLLKDALEETGKEYDYIIIDTPPALGNLLMCSLVASDYVLIPTDARPLSIKGLDALEPTLTAVKAMSKKLSVLGIVLVKYSERTILNRQMCELLDERAQEMDTVLFKTKIREGVAVPEAQAMQLSLIDYAPRSKPLMDYEQLVDEILAKIEG